MSFFLKQQEYANSHQIMDLGQMAFNLEKKANEVQPPARSRSLV